MNAPTSPRRRLQELLAIPDSQRTDAQWDELNELEIKLAPGNREASRQPEGRRNVPSGGGHADSGGGAHGKRGFKKFQKRPPRGNAP